MNVVSIRGAITIEKNDKKLILQNTAYLISEIINKNNLDKDDIVSIFFTATRDLDEVYPAKAARDMGLTNCSLLCSQEMYVKNSLTKCIRVMMLVNSLKTQREVKNIYLKDAIKLRPDLVD